MKIPDWLGNNYKLVLVLFALGIMIYLAYVLWHSKGSEKIEGFTDQELSDLLDKIRVNIYNKDSEWNNKFYNNQPERRETPLSFWNPLISDNNTIPRGLKILGTCVSDKSNYDSPSETTMLITGDVKAPVGANEVFKFPHNQITRPRFDSSGQITEKYVLNNIKNFEDIDVRIGVIQSYIDSLNEKYTELREVLKNINDEISKYTIFDVIAYGPESYFNKAAYSVKISNGETVILPDGQYSSLRLPIGSSGTLVYEDGFTEAFSFPFNRVIDPKNPNKFKNEATDKSLTYKDINEENADSDKWMISGKYGLGFLKDNIPYIFYTSESEYLNLGAIDTSVSYGTSLNFGFGDRATDAEYEGLYGFGKSDLVTYFNRLRADGSKKIVPVEEYKNSEVKDTMVIIARRDEGSDTKSDYWFVIPKLDWKIKTYGNKRPNEDYAPKDVTIIESPHILENNQQLPGFLDVITNLERINNTKLEFLGNNSWYIPGVAGSAVVNDSELKDKGFTIKQIYIDLAFRMHTMKKSLRGDGVICPAGNLCNCCNIDYDKWVGLWPDGKDHGNLVSATITMNLPNTTIPYFKRFYNINSQIINYVETELTSANKQLAELYDFKTLINNNLLEQYPMRIIRPSPPDGYTSLGDVLFNHMDPNYSAKLPLIDKYACVPTQCVRSVREWLASDKIYEYNRDGKYLGIYKNPYLQTFRATTVPNIFPPGKVNKIVACVERCKLVDEIIGADKCARKFYNSNKAVLETTNLDNDSAVLSRESALYKDKIRERQDKITELQDVARKLKVQDEKAELVNREFNRQKLQDVIGSQRVNIGHLTDRMAEERGQVNINLGFDYAKFLELLYKLEVVPNETKQKIIKLVDESAGKKMQQLPDDMVNAILAQCPTPESEGLVRKSLVESGCLGCANLQ